MQSVINKINRQSKTEDLNNAISFQDIGGMDSPSLFFFIICELPYILEKDSGVVSHCFRSIYFFYTFRPN